jgi:uncharacterized membrane protein YqhA
MLRRLLTSSRLLVLVAVLGSFVAAITILVYAGITVVGVSLHAFGAAEFTPDGAKHLAVDMIEMIDLFLLGLVLYIVALGLYELFIDSSVRVPSWRRIRTLDDLKADLIAVVAVLLAVTFLGNVVTWTGSLSIAALGGAIGLVLFALGYFRQTGMGSPEEPWRVTSLTARESNGGTPTDRGASDDATANMP